MTNDNFCLYLQNRLIQTSQTGGQWYRDTSPLVFPCNTILKSFVNPILGWLVTKLPFNILKEGVPCHERDEKIGHLFYPYCNFNR
jgi:hypothetical protein